MLQLHNSDVEHLLLENKAKLGQGSYGKVTLVQWEDSKAVLKVGHNASVLDSFRHEAEYLQKLDGAGGAPRLLGLGQDPPALLMTYCGHKTL